MRTEPSPDNGTNRSFSQHKHVLKPRENGMVLIIVLVCIALLAILIISFMSGATTELAASKQYSVSAQTQNLASSALNLAMGQVAMGAKANQNTISWASQPGMIRNFDASSTNAVALYKLYSSSQMTLTGSDAAAFDPALELPPQDWDAEPSLYTDLNEPAEVGGQMRFPIVDPRASAGANAVAGFSYTNSINGVTLATSDSDANARLPMPVQWLYVLKDGSFVAASSANGTTAIVNGASKINPIIGRVAFWTDDESTKVNVNTAAEGSYWDDPFVFSPDDYQLDYYPPVQAEFQRYPGHPSTTSLSAVFPGLKGSTAGSANTSFYQIAPRIEQGGSLEGTRAALPPGAWASSVAKIAMQLDSARLYDSVDEAIFDPSRSYFNLTAEEIEQRRFFLTAQSRAPELTLFNTPRVSIWPLHTKVTPSERSVAEDLIAFASTTRGAAGREFFFTRSNPRSPTVDLADTGRNGRNGEILTYLKNLTEKPIPGFGTTTLSSKWGADRDQILLQIFDFCRSTVSLRNALNPAKRAYTDRPAAAVGENVGYMGTVYPTVMADGSRGFGRYATPSEVALLVGCEAPKDTALPAADQFTKIWPAIIIEMLLTSPGSKLSQPDYCVKVSGLKSFQWRYRKPVAGVVTEDMWTNDVVTLYSKAGYFNQSVGGFMASYYPSSLLYAKENTNFTPFTQGNIQGNTADNLDPTFDFLGGTITFTVGITDAPDASPQTFTITFPPILGLANPDYVAPPAKDMPVNSMAARTTPGDTFTVNNFIQNADVVKGMEVRHGDIRLVATKSTVKGGVASDPTNDFVPHPNYGDASKRQSHLLRLYNPLYAGPSRPEDFGLYVPGLNNYRGFSGNLGFRPKISSANTQAANVLGKVGDWDTGLGSIPDGPFINKPDEGGDYLEQGGSYLAISYLSPAGASTNQTELYFSPSRQMASPVMFGSLPTGAARNHPWQTLLFCPNPAAGFTAADHPGFALQPDHLLLDLFWMPVTEPYAISDPFSTAGKINLNTQILPFSYIERNTGIHALLKNEKVTAIPDSSINRYKVWYPDTNPAALKTRFNIDIPETLKQFTSRFKSGDVFRSASQICEIFLVPEGQTEANVKSFWASHKLTGDNVRERPYNAIYPRVTTQSNVFTVYVNAQALKQVPSTLNAAPATFTEGKDIVEGEFQASYTFERYIDPNASLTGADTDPLGPFYKLRVINQRNLSY